MAKKLIYTLQYESFQWLEKWQNTQALLESAASQNYPELEEVKEDVERAIALLMGRYPFFGAFIYKFRILYVPADDPDIQTMATDGKNIFINPAFAKSMTDKQTIFVLCHEILHNVMLHFQRMYAKGADPGKWNIAADYEINPMLVDEGLLTKDEVINQLHGLYKDEYAGKSAEEIYDEEGNKKMPELPKELLDKMKEAMKDMPKPPPSKRDSKKNKAEKKGEEGESQSGEGQEDEGGEGGEGGDGEGQDGKGQSGESKSAREKGIGGLMDKDESIKKQKELDVPVETSTEKEDKTLIEEAIRNKKKLKGGQAGSGTGGYLRKAIESFEKPQKNWKNELKRIVGKMVGGSEDYFGKKKHLYKDDYFYGDRELVRTLKDAVMPVDLSGSISDDDLKIILGEVCGIIKAKKIRRTEVVYFDDVIKNYDVVKNPPKFDWEKTKGRGGTSFVEPMEYLAKQNKSKKLEVAVFCTDGIADMKAFDQNPKFAKKFVWLIIDNPNFVAPFGKVVHITTK